MTEMADRTGHARIDVKDGPTVALLAAWVVALLATFGVLFMGG